MEGAGSPSWGVPKSKTKHSNPHIYLRQEFKENHQLPSWGSALNEENESQVFPLSFPSGIQRLGSKGMVWKKWGDLIDRGEWNPRSQKSSQESTVLRQPARPQPPHKYPADSKAEAHISKWVKPCTILVSKKLTDQSMRHSAPCRLTARQSFGPVWLHLNLWVFLQWHVTLM